MAKAAEIASEYEWMKAAELYQQALNQADVEHDAPEAARITELLAKCLFKGAFQAESREELKRMMRLSKDAHDRAATLYDRAHSEGLSRRSKARGLFGAFWGKDSPSERAETIGECVKSTYEAAKLFENQGSETLLAETYVDLISYLTESMMLTREWRIQEEQFESALRVGENAIILCARLGYDQHFLESYCSTVLLIAALAQYMLQPQRFQELTTRMERLKTKVDEAAGRLGTPYARCLGSVATGWITVQHQGDFTAAVDKFEAGIPAAESTKDSWMTGCIYSGALYAARWMGLCEEDVDLKRAAIEKAIGFAQKAISNLEISSDGWLLDQVYGNLAECQTELSVSVETEREAKMEHLRRAVEIARKGTTYAPYATTPVASHALSKAMYFLASMETRHEVRLQLLEEALPIREETVRTHDLLAPHSWDRGVTYNYLALIEAELASMERDPKVKARLLQNAVSDMQQCVSLCSKWATDLGTMRALATYGEWYGDILARLYEQTSEKDTAKQAIKVYEDSIGYLGKLEVGGAMAAMRWKIGKIYDTMGDYRAASDAFGESAKNFRQGAKKVLGLASIFGELASYMDAWVEIEESRLLHDEGQYFSAAEKYNLAASRLQATKRSSLLSGHYVACSHLEEGEGLSRQEKEDEAIASFTAAIKSFGVAKTSLEGRLREPLEPREEEELKHWIKVTEDREKYCQGRIDVEMAKTLDKKGDRAASAAKYRSASETFKALLAEPRSEQDRGEIQTLILFCDAWAKMKDAEEEASPGKYAEASESFMKVRETTTSKKSRLLAVANASMCKALELGTKFRLTRNTQLYSDIKKQLETAADYYAQAGLENAAGWTHATQRLFDSLLYLANAETEADPKKKTELYHLAEKHLDLAAKLYGEAGFQGRRGEALKHLKRAREEKELLLTPVEALSDNPAASKVSVTPVSLLRDRALGLERFEAAQVVGNISVPQREIKAGSDLTLQLELANIGRTAAMLLKLENVAPDGFALDLQKTPHPSFDNSIDLRGKRLEYLSTHGLSIALKALRKGTFDLHPKVLFVDDKGNYKSYEFEPIPLTVAELGISGWLKGPSD